MTRKPHVKRAFTLIELLLVVAILAILSVVLILTLNPAELLRQGRDSSRLSDMDTIAHAVAISQTDALSLGHTGVVYVSVPDASLAPGATSTCANLGLTPLPSGWTYQCVSTQSLRKIDGTGWIPITLTKISIGGSPLSAWPIDPVNQTSTGEYYAYVTDGTHYEVTANFESQKYLPQEAKSNGSIPFLFEKGTILTLLPEDYGCGGGGPCVFVVDTGNNRIEQFDTLGNYVGKFGGAGSGNGQLNNPMSVDIDTSGNVYVADRDNDRVEKFDTTGRYLSQFGSSLQGAVGLAVAPDGSVYVGDRGNNRVEKFDNNGNYILQFGTLGTSTPGTFDGVASIAVDASGSVIVADNTTVGSYVGRVQKFTSGGAYSQQIGSGGSGNGQYNAPSGVEFDSAGNLYVGDSNNFRIEKFGPAPFYTFAYATGTYGGGPGQFGPTGGISVDLGGNIYAVDNQNNRIEKFNASGTFLLQFGTLGSGNGQLSSPMDIVVR
ncbi:MAG TPA: prepilin-type N-terminal cleavage/methylation domain-containing protein [Candidatus Paceibacterota bacterium]|nr:prepilin-type N-terminal cleavage/methylation domain-containing protein [Candidatus Paceibacterota bacterium]